MRARAGILVAAVCALAIALAAATASAAGSARLTPLRSFVFPARGFVLTLPKAVALDTRGAQVWENGAPVNRLSVIPASLAANNTFGVVLVVDSSWSMRGKAIAGALAAARAFATHRTQTESLGLIQFNKDVEVETTPTTDPTKIAKALGQKPKLVVGTLLYDAAAEAIDVLQREHVTAGSVVLLTDGRDTGSKTSLEELSKKAQAAGVRLFGVGLRSGQYTPEPLQQLSRETGASYTDTTSPAKLAGIYSALSKKFGSEYLVRYRSLLGPGAKAQVKLALPGVTGLPVYNYRTPPLPTEVTAPFHRSFVDRFVSSTGSVAALSLLVALLAAFAVTAIARRSGSTFRSRIAQFVTVSDRGESSRQDGEPHGPLSLMMRAFEKELAGKSWWEAFKSDLEIAEFPIGPAPFLLGTAAATVLLALLLGLISPIFSLCALLLPLLAREAYTRRLRQKRSKFEAQLPENLTVLAASLRAGHSFVGALDAVLEQADEPARSELRRAVADEQLGVPVEDALLRVADRMQNGDLEQVALVASLQRDTGGNTAAVLDTVVNGIRERFEVRLIAKSLTAQGRLTRWILMALPLAVALLVAIVNPHYLAPLFHTTGGQVMLVLAIVLVAIGSVWIGRIMEVRV